MSDTIQLLTPPETCPSCSGPVTTELAPEKTNKATGEVKHEILTHYRGNDACPGRMAAHFAYIGKREVMDIEGLGDVIAEQLVTMGVAPTLGYLWQWGTEAEASLAETPAVFEAACADAGFPPAQIRTLVGSLAAAKTAPWDKWLQGLGIPSIAKELARSIAAHLNLQPDDMMHLPERLVTIVPGELDGLGPERVKEIQAWAMSPTVALDLQLLHDAGVRPASTVVVKEGPQPLAGLVICLTGEFGEDREAISKKLEKLGAICKGMSKKINLLLVGEGAGRNKTSKANELGIRQEGKAWLIAALASGGLILGASGMPDDSEMLDEL